MSRTGQQAAAKGKSDMGNIDALYRDSYHDSLDDALREAHNRKVGEESVLTKVEESPYGGWRVRSISAEFALDLMADSSAMQSASPRKAYT
jgi:hypothetical protein